MLALLNEKDICKIELMNINSVNINISNKFISIRDYKKECIGTQIILLSGEKKLFIDYINELKKKTGFAKQTKSYFDTFPESINKYKTEYEDMLKA